MMGTSDGEDTRDRVEDTVMSLAAKWGGLTVAVLLVAAILASDFLTQWWPSRAITAGLVSSAIVILVTVALVDRVVERRLAARLRPLNVVALDDFRRELEGARGDTFDERASAITFTTVTCAGTSDIQATDDRLIALAQQLSAVRRDLAAALARWSPLLGTTGIDDQILSVAGAYTKITRAHDATAVFSRELMFSGGPLISGDPDAWDYVHRWERELAASIDDANAALQSARTSVTTALHPKQQPATTASP